MSAPAGSTPVTIITGFLGAGKTTLLNNILRADHGLRVAVLVNDFGAVNIDAELIVGVEGESVRLANGCICCTIRDDLLQATLNVIERDDKPDLVIIETSGVSDPFAVASTFMLPQLRALVHVDGIVTLVDAEQARDFSGEQAVLLMDQIAAGDIILLNKSDLVTPKVLAEVTAWIRDIVPNARILEVVRADVPLEFVLGVGEFSAERVASREPRDVHVHAADEPHAHDHTLVFDTWSFRTDEPLAHKKIRKLIDDLPTTIIRAKGVLNLRERADRRTVLHVVGKRASLTPGEPWGATPPHSQVVVIGTSGGVDAEWLAARFAACETQAANASDADKLGQALDWVRSLWAR